MKRETYIDLVNALVSVVQGLPPVSSGEAEVRLRSSIENVLETFQVTYAEDESIYHKIIGKAVAHGYTPSTMMTLGGRAEYATDYLAKLVAQCKDSMTPQDKQYASLRAVLNLAYEQAAIGKGAERHANCLPFDEQPMQSISDSLGTNAGLLFQAQKKVAESVKLPHYNRRERELLGAINYIAGAIIWDSRNTMNEVTRDAED